MTAAENERDDRRDCRGEDEDEEVDGEVSARRRNFKMKTAKKWRAADGAGALKNVNTQEMGGKGDAFRSVSVLWLVGGGRGVVANRDLFVSDAVAGASPSKMRQLFKKFT